MRWQTVRLELGSTSEFPNGSPSRCYFLRLPLTESGLIDEGAVRAAPERATIRRFWPSQPDLLGYALKIPGGWAFSSELGKKDDEAVFCSETEPIRIGEYINLAEPDGQRRPFRVAGMQELT